MVGTSFWAKPHCHPSQLLGVCFLGLSDGNSGLCTSHEEEAFGTAMLMISRGCRRKNSNYAEKQQRNGSDTGLIELGSGSHTDKVSHPVSRTLFRVWIGQICFRPSRARTAFTLCLYSI